MLIILWGATVRNDGEKVAIGRVIRGGLVGKSNLLHEGDELIEVNGIDLRGKHITEVCEILVSLLISCKIIVK